MADLEAMDARLTRLEASHAALREEVAGLVRRGWTRERKPSSGPARSRGRPARAFEQVRAWIVANGDRPFRTRDVIKGVTASQRSVAYALARLLHEMGWDAKRIMYLDTDRIHWRFDSAAFAKHEIPAQKPAQAEVMDL